jgi:hypothetical protein
MVDDDINNFLLFQSHSISRSVVRRVMSSGPLIDIIVVEEVRNVCN